MAFFCHHNQLVRTTGLCMLAGVLWNTTNCDAVSITGFSPATATPGEVVTISGSGFSTTASANTVYFGAVRGTVLGDPAPTSSSISVVVPIGATYAQPTVNVGGQVATAGIPFQPTFAVDANDVSLSTFASRYSYGTGSGPLFAALADIDNDGKPDVIVNNTYSHTFSAYRNVSASGVIGSGSFDSKVDFAVGGSSDSPYGLAIADVDGDGKLDVVEVERNNNKVSVFRNTTSAPGSFSSGTFASQVDVTTGSDPRHVAVADLNGDGKPDIVTANYGGNNISILQNNGSPGTISFAAKQDVAAATGAYDIVIADLDGDNQLDIAVLCYDKVSLYRNLGAGGTLSGSSFASRVDLPGITYAVGMTVGDLTGDGKPELITTSCYMTLKMAVYRNVASSGSLTTSSFDTAVEFSPGCWGHTLALSDLNGDKKADIGFVGELSSKLSVYQNQSSGGTFTTTSLKTPINFTTGWNAWGIAAGDVDSDGRPDLIYCNAYDVNFSVYRNQLPWTAKAYAALENVTPETVLTDFDHNDAMRDGTHGTYGEWYLEMDPNATHPQHGDHFKFVAHGSSLHKSVTVDGTTYAPSSSTHGFALDLTHNYSWVTYWLHNANNPTKQATVSGFVTFGAAPNPSGRQLFDTICISDYPNEAGFAMQLQNGVGSLYALNIESNISGTKHSEEITISPNTTYWCCLRADFTKGQAQLAVYETVNWKLVGAVSLQDVATGNDVLRARIGNAEIGTSPGNFTYFENLCFDVSNSAFPFGP